MSYLIFINIQDTSIIWQPPVIVINSGKVYPLFSSLPSPISHLIVTFVHQSKSTNEILTLTVRIHEFENLNRKQ